MTSPSESDIPDHEATNWSKGTIQAMDAEQVLLFQRIQDFSIDRDNTSLSFSQRLAADNGWQMSFALSVIEEYKRFVFLALTADHPVTPSDQIDQAWHLHLSYSRSYWETFCPQILGKAFHHEPTRGSAQENDTFRRQYQQTLESYEKRFGESPPEDVWPSVNARFERDIGFVRINSQRNWIIPKLPIHRQLVAVITASLMFVLGLSFIHSPTHSNISISSFFAPVVLAITGYGSIIFSASLLDALHKPFISSGCQGGGL